MSDQLRTPSTRNCPILNGAILAAYAELAYDPPNDRVDIEPFSHHNASGLMARPNDSTIVIAIAGTNDFIDAKQDLDIQSTTLTASRLGVHNGFASYCLHVRSALVRHEGLLNSGVQVWLTGHSLGGAAAVLLPLLMDLPDTTRIATFGAPPTITQGYGGRYVRPVTRFAHVNDVVPKAYRYEYEHVGRPFWIRANGKVSGSPSAIHRGLALLAKAWRIITQGPFGANKHYHSMTRYRQLLEAAK